MSNKYFERLDYSGDLAEPLAELSSAFSLGTYISYAPILIGYEDFNLRLETNKGSFFVKFFSKERTDADCERYARVIREVVDGGINHPAYQTADSKIVYRPTGTNLRAIVLEWIEDEHHYDVNQVNDNDRKLVVEQAVKINSLNINLQPQDFADDSWAINNFAREYSQWRHTISAEDQALIEPALKDYQAIDSEALTKAFVHGDLIRTNVIRKRDTMYVFDFSVSNIYPRVQELAVLLSDLFFDSTSQTETDRLYRLLLDEYQHTIKLTDEELTALPAFVRAAHAMHVIGAARSENEGEGGEENNFWWNQGRSGLQMTYPLNIASEH